MKLISLLAIHFLFITSAFTQAMDVSCGSLIRLENFPSEHVAERHIDIWLPKNYNPHKKYAVLYMHDGQMLFDEHVYANESSGMVDEILDSLMKYSLIKECIVVGIWTLKNEKVIEYFPEKALSYLSGKEKKIFLKEHDGMTLMADEYLKFLVLELKPYIDRNFSVYPDPQHTFIAGWKEAALFSMYAVCEYPNIFHAAACISVLQNNVKDALLKYMKKNMPDPVLHRFYFDYSNVTSDIPDDFQNRLDALFHKNKYNSKNYLSMSTSEAAIHEQDQHKRLYLPLMFLLSKN